MTALNLLLLTPDASAAMTIEAAATRYGIRTRLASNSYAAREWLEKQAFDIVLVDYAAEPIRGLEILELGWKRLPSAIAAIFSLDNFPPDMWSASLLGARVFLGPNALERIKGLFASIPRDPQASATPQSAIVLVEDLDSPRDIIQTYIQSMGFPDVRPAASAESALEILRANPKQFFAVVSDIHMPSVSGIALTAQIRKDARLAHLPVIILTADPTAENVIQCIKAGASGFLAKPPKKESLRKELEKAKRMTLTKMSPRLCEPEDAHLLEGAVDRIKSRS